MSEQALAWFETHRSLLEGATRAWHSRASFRPFVESPSRKHHPEGAHGKGREAFAARLNCPFPVDALGAGLGVPAGVVGSESSPYTGQSLGIAYPRFSPDVLLAAATEAGRAWADAALYARIGVGLEILDRWAKAAFENAYATMHTTGQAFMLAFAGSGASSLERGLEGLTAAALALEGMPKSASFERPFGPGEPVKLHKRYYARPVGVAVVVSCGSYPAWNMYPAILANLVTANPVVVKPHPDCILPVAIAVQIAREVLAGAGFDPNVLTLAPDTWAEPVVHDLLGRPETAIVDFTGGQAFGRELETRYPQLQVYTETAGCNSVILESTFNLDATLDAVAHGICLYSSQMCTAPQNVWVPESGVRVGTAVVPRPEVLARLVAAIDRYALDPKLAPAVLGALHLPRTLAEIEAVATSGAGSVLRPSAPYAHPEHAAARTATPLIVDLDENDRGVAQREHFGPVVFTIRTDDAERALAGATADASEFGSIAAYVYSTDAEFCQRAASAYVHAGASVGFNLHRQRPIQFAAALSDYHVTGLNPAGTACLTDPAFVARRFRVVQTKFEIQ